MVWRRVLVPETYSLRELHGVIQVAMGWESLHLFEFRIRAVRYGSSDICPEPPDKTLESFAFRKNARFAYVYDMGDWWEHEIRVEDRGGGIRPASAARAPVHRRIAAAQISRTALRRIWP